jgi:hypothetical protein
MALYACVNEPDPAVKAMQTTDTRHVAKEKATRRAHDRASRRVEYETCRQCRSMLTDSTKVSVCNDQLSNLDAVPILHKKWHNKMVKDRNWNKYTFTFRSINKCDTHSHDRQAAEHPSSPIHQLTRQSIQPVRLRVVSKADSSKRDRNTHTFTGSIKRGLFDERSQ